MADAIGMERNRTPRTPLPADVPLHLGLIRGEGFGWGHCANELGQHLDRLHGATFLDGPDDPGPCPGALFQALTGHSLGVYFQARAALNVGYTFFELPLTADAARNASGLDAVLGGSTWCQERLAEAGVPEPGLLIQGVDPAVFPVLPPASDTGPFVIFSGGKMELRKGQDLVLAAFKRVQDLLPDAVLIGAWHNLWEVSWQTIEGSPHLEVPPVAGQRIQGWVEDLCRRNGIDHRRVFALPAFPQEMLREVLSRVHVGVFPNRCEGGTNLVLMECMASGRPVIASTATGHRDVVAPDAGFWLEEQHPFALPGADLGGWVESSVDEIAARLLDAAADRARLKEMGRKAGAFLQRFTWEASARSLLATLGELWERRREGRERLAEA